MRQMEGILFINFLIQNYFLNTRSRQSSFLLTNQNAHLITHEPRKFRFAKVKIKFSFVEIAGEQSERRANESDISFGSF